MEKNCVKELHTSESSKKKYSKPTLKSTKIEDIIMLASGRPGMGMCKITFE